MILGRVRSGHDENVVHDDLRCGVAHGRRADRLLKRDHRTRVAKSCAMVHVVGAEQGAVHFLQEVIVFVRGFGAAIDRHRVGAVAVVNAGKVIGGDVECGVPVGFDPIGESRDWMIRDWFSVFSTNLKSLFSNLCPWLAFQQIPSHHRRCDTLGVINKVVTEASLHAQVSVVDRRIEGRGDLEDKIIFDVQLKITPHAAIGTGGRNHPVCDNTIGIDHFSNHKVVSSKFSADLSPHPPFLAGKGERTPPPFQGGAEGRATPLPSQGRGRGIGPLHSSIILCRTRFKFFVTSSFSNRIIRNPSDFKYPSRCASYSFCRS